jgi:hypothetical protein
LNDRPYNTWNEKCLTCGQILYAFKAQVRLLPGYFNIGEHAVMRLYMRAPVLDKNGKIVPYSILEQLKYLPLWATFWVWVRMLLRNGGFNSPFSPVLPAPSGLFLSELGAKNDIGIEIRTFINDLQLSAERKLVRDLMLKISDPLLRSPMCASPAVESHGDYANSVLTLMMATKLLPYVDRIANLIFEAAEGHVISSDSKTFFVQRLKDMTPEDDRLWDFFKTSSVDAQRKFLTRLNHSLRGKGGSVSIKT